METNKDNKYDELNSIDHTNEKTFVLEFYKKESSSCLWASCILTVLGLIMIFLGIILLKDNIFIYNQLRFIVLNIYGLFFISFSIFLFSHFYKTNRYVLEKALGESKYKESLIISDDITDEDLKAKVKAILSINSANIRFYDAALDFIKEKSEKDGAL